MTRIIEGDTIGAADCLALVRGLTSSDREERLGAAVVAGDWFGGGGLDYTEDVTAAWVLAWAAVREPPGGLVRADMLDSLESLAADDRAPAAALRLVTTALDRADVSPAELDFYDGLVEALARPGPASPGGSGRPLGAQRCLALVRGLASGVDADRRAAATAVAGHAAAGDLDAGESSTVATVLAWAVELERRPARPVLLSALLVLAERGSVPARVLDRVVTHLAGARLDPVEEGFLADLTAALHRPR
ncbi:hypothetical protein [Pseudonocardia lacus]|uniref:hypothetical protein n=1 Tax=Pseudonocardia lacus TaxID=2835865 RepID=UPI001BDC3E28|nr:hypothetical protein [Pseudonocardia lacus]